MDHLQGLNFALRDHGHDPVHLALLIFWVLMIVDCTQRKFEDSNTRLMWLLIILMVPFGALIYCFVGRKQGTR